jgi:hypothetical protein
MIKSFLIFSLSVLGTGSIIASNSEAEIFIDSISVGKNSISIYGKCSSASVHTHLSLLLNEFFVDGETMDVHGLAPFVLSASDLSPGSAYSTKIAVRDNAGFDTISLGTINTLSGGGWGGGSSGGVFSIKNQSLIRFSGSTKVELRGIIELSPNTTAVAYACVFSDSLCTRAIAPISTRLNYSNSYNFSSIYNLYYDFNIDTNYYNFIWGKFWGSDNMGNSASDFASVKIKILSKKITGQGEVKRENILFAHPIPAKDFLFLNLHCQYVVYDILGNVVLSGAGKEIDVQGIPVGWYLFVTDFGSIRFWKN